MHFTTIQFALFFLVVLSLNWALRPRTRVYKYFLLAANYFFYACLDPRFLFILLGVSLSNWFFAERIVGASSKKNKKRWLTLDLALNLACLALFKYLEYFYSLLLDISYMAGLYPVLTPPEIVFPIGISFFTFQGLSYCIDVFRDHRQKARSLLDVLVFVSFFPTIMSGPIMRARNFLPQISRPQYDSRSFRQGFALLLSGMFKKVVIASYLSEHIVREVFQVPSNYSSLTVLTAVYSYSLQIFCDFSGYSDMAMGLALLMGYRLPENFQSPYRATDLQEFWRRWHISFSTWLRDYLYIPLGGNRHGRVRKYLNLMITMTLGGLWHGANSRFLIWGAMHGAGLTLTHMYNDFRKNRLPGSIEEMRRRRKEPEPWVYALQKTAAWFLTFNAVSFLWVFFRAEDSQRAFEIFRSILAVTQPGNGFEFMVVVALAAGLGVQFLGRYLQDAFIRVQEDMPVFLQGCLIALLCIVILRMGPEGVLPFIYFQF